ncbi:WD40/YVTN/BNR-like repeat-containing protein [Portibacter marinus]|uniref:WD40/YVTN/BNR-like repeat-containing protein n=1 Tax=Portibacter marinus TaxID=2898660 RepID=UPI001F2118F2|nr:hypothetical protein [Portibacter marinus]
MKNLSIYGLMLLSLFVFSCEKEPIDNEDEPMDEVVNELPSIEVSFNANSTLKQQNGDEYTVEVPREADLSIQYKIKTPAGYKTATFGGDPLSDVGQFSLNSSKTGGTFDVTLIYLSGGLPPFRLEVEDMKGNKVEAKVLITLPLGFDASSVLQAEWEEVTFDPFSENQFGQQLFATLDGSLLTHFDNVIYRSTDQGESWEPISVPSFNGWFSKFTQHPDGKLYVGAYEPGNLYTSNDDGVSWTKVQTDLPVFSGISQMVISSENEFYIAGWLNAQNSTVDGVYKSANGLKWQKVLNVGGIEGISLGSSSEVFVHTAYPASLHHSLGGESWNKLTIPSAEFVVDAARISDGILITTDQNVYISKDEGSSWEVFNDGLPQSEFLKNLTVMESGEIYATPGNYGVFKLTEDQNWRSVGTALGTYQIWSLTSLQGQLFASGINNEKIYKLK